MKDLYHKFIFTYQVLIDNLEILIKNQFLE